MFAAPNKQSQRDFTRCLRQKHSQKPLLWGVRTQREIILNYLKIGFIGFFLSFTSVAATVKHTGQIKNIRVIYWAEDRACLNVDDKWFKLDLSTEKGKAIYAFSLAAFSTGKQVRVSWLDDAALEGGCDTGTTMFPLYNIQFAEE